MCNGGLMMNKRIFSCLIAIFLLFCSIGVLSAADVNGTNVDMENTICSDDNSVILSKNSNSNLLGANNYNDDNTNSFTKLSENINASSKTLTLTQDYEYTNSDGESGIVVNKTNFVIDGKGHTIDANGKSKIFDIYGNDVVLKNMILTNANAQDGSAIHINVGSTVTTINVTFKFQFTLIRYSICRVINI